MGTTDLGVADPERDSPTRPERVAAGPAAGTPVAAAGLLGLQRAVGNRAVARLLQRSLVPPAVLQRHCYEEYATFAQARRANPYSEKHLDTQKNDPIDRHERRGFDPNQRAAIIQTNKDDHGGRIISDADGATELFELDVATTPHIDHRFPSQKGGSNSFMNARVLSAAENLAKSSNATDLAADPANPGDALPQYQGLAATYPGSVGRYGRFSAEQREAIKAANRAHNGGTLKSDVSGAALGGGDSSTLAHIDHIKPKSRRGCNYYFNAQVIPADANITKSNLLEGETKRRSQFVSVENEDEISDDEVGRMSLEKYYRKYGTATGRGRVRKRSPAPRRDRSASPVH
jgi:hypothetical protein